MGQIMQETETKNITEAKRLVREYINRSYTLSASEKLVFDYEVEVVSYEEVVADYWKAILTSTMPDGIRYKVEHDLITGETELNAYETKMSE